MLWKKKIEKIPKIGREKFTEFKKGNTFDRMHSEL